MIIPVDIEECKSAGLPMSENSISVAYEKEGARVYFSFSMMGDAMDCHVAAVGRSKLLLREAINCFVPSVFDLFPKINKVTGCVGKRSVVNLLKKCGFVCVAQKPIQCDNIIQTAYFMVRGRHGIH